uniref:Secreted protein n=1 Tax=Rhipicephalus appendiculatus TaxID=34631 RepID=A0A131YGY2_RHIAP
MKVFPRVIPLFLALFLLFTWEPAGVLGMKPPPGLSHLTKALGNAFSVRNPVPVVGKPAGMPQASGRMRQHEGGPSRPALNPRPNAPTSFHKGILRNPGDTHANTGRRVQFAEKPTVKVF